VLVLLSDFLVGNIPITSPVQLLDAQEAGIVETATSFDEATLMAESSAPESQRNTPGEDEVTVTESPPMEEPALSLEMEQIVPDSTPFEAETPEQQDGISSPDPILEGKEGSISTVADSQGSPQQILVARRILRIVEIILILIAVTSGIAAIILYQRRIT
jgi:hypothetical protein